MVNVSAALMLGFFGAVAGFVVGVFTTIAHPIYMEHRQNYLKSKESRKLLAAVVAKFERTIRS